ncbi:MAG: carbon starvation protein A [Erysipelotrichaceae bacterium]|nr:carbon starvation protein A [Erysipelotrichaceae bacterium]
MNGLLLLAIAAIILVLAYLLYGRYLVRTWGIDENAKTPAVEKEDGVDYVPSNKWGVFTHQFSSIAGAGPVTGPVMALVWGWLPAVLWILIGGVFFGAVQDFGALYASVKSQGKSIGGIIEEYIGKTGRRLFFLFCWLFTILVIAAFADMVEGTFNGFSATDGSTVHSNGAAASISMLYIFVAIAFGLFLKRYKISESLKFIVSIALIILMLVVGIAFPIYLDKTTWGYIIFIYIFFASITPMWLLKQPRDYLTSFLFIGMIIAAVIGVFVYNPTISTPAFTAFETTSGYMVPTLFVTIACGAVSGFHSLVSSETSSKQISNEKDMLQVGYGSMLLESLLAILVIVVVGSLSSLVSDGTLNTTLATLATADGATPFTKFAIGVTGLISKLGFPQEYGICIMTMFVSALALSTLDAVARIGRLSFQELFQEEDEQKSSFNNILKNKYFATIITLVFGYLLSLGGYSNVWAIFGATNQLLAAMVLISLSVFLKVTGRNGKMLYIPMIIMLIMTISSLSLSVYSILSTWISTGTIDLLTSGLQLIIAILVMALGILVAYLDLKKLLQSKVS